MHRRSKPCVLLESNFVALMDAPMLTSQTHPTRKVQDRKPGADEGVVGWGSMPERMPPLIVHPDVAGFT